MRNLLLLSARRGGLDEKKELLEELIRDIKLLGKTTRTNSKVRTLLIKRRRVMDIKDSNDSRREFYEINAQLWKIREKLLSSKLKTEASISLGKQEAGSKYRLEFKEGTFLCPICGRPLYVFIGPADTPVFKCRYCPQEEYSIWRAHYGYEVNANTKQEERRQIIDEICKDGLGHKFLHWLDFRFRLYDKNPDYFYAAHPNTLADIEYLLDKLKKESFPTECINSRIKRFFIKPKQI